MRVIILETSEGETVAGDMVNRLIGISLILSGASSRSWHVNISKGSGEKFAGVGGLSSDVECLLYSLTITEVVGIHRQHSKT